MSGKKNIIKRVWFVSVAIAVAAVVFVGFIDARLSNDDPNENARDLSGVKEKARADREYIKVTLQQLREIVSGVRDRHPVDYSALVMQDVSDNDTVVMINLEGVEPHYVGMLIGLNENLRLAMNAWCGRLPSLRREEPRSERARGRHENRNAPWSNRFISHRFNGHLGGNTISATDAAQSEHMDDGLCSWIHLVIKASAYMVAPTTRTLCQIVPAKDASVCTTGTLWS